jgi:hypothetical protein
MLAVDPDPLRRIELLATLQLLQGPASSRIWGSCHTDVPSPTVADSDTSANDTMRVVTGLAIVFAEPALAVSWRC